MKTTLTWDENKRVINLKKHGLDFANAYWVLGSHYRMDVVSARDNEERTVSFSYVFDMLAVLTVVHTERDGASRIISFRYASAVEREVYDVWLESE